MPEAVRNVQGTLYYGFLAPLALYGGLAFIVRRHRLKQTAAAGKEAA